MHFQSLSNVRDGILFAEIDLNLCGEMNRKFGFQQSQRLDYYKNKFEYSAKIDSTPQIIHQTE